MVFSDSLNAVYLHPRVVGTLKSLLSFSNSYELFALNGRRDTKKLLSYSHKQAL